MSITLLERNSFEACKKVGFVFLNWEEGIDDLTGEYRHCGCLEGKKFSLKAYVIPTKLNPNSSKIQYISYVTFVSRSDLGNLYCETEKRVSYELEDAFDFVHWKATLIIKLIEEDKMV